MAEQTGQAGKQVYEMVPGDPHKAYMKVIVKSNEGLAAGEDTVHNTVRIERQGHYETVAASQTDQVCGAAGAIGDYLEKLIVTVATAATAAVSIKDGGGSSIPILPNSPGGGIGVYVVPCDMVSVAGAWKVTTGAGSTVVAVGRFT